MYSFTPNFDKPVFARIAPLEVNLLQGSVQVGFPSPAEDLGSQRIDLVQLLIRHSQATYFLGASGQSMTKVGIFEGDILVVDRANKPSNTHIVLASLEGEFNGKQLYQRAWCMKLKAASPSYPDITPKDGQTIEVWGVVTATIKQFHN